MANINKILKEYEIALKKKQKLSERLKQTEKAEPNNIYQIWILRDQIAYWPLTNLRNSILTPS